MILIAAATACAIISAEAVPVRPWVNLQQQLDTGGAVTLTQNYTAMNGDRILTVTTDVTLDLADHTIDAAEKECGNAIFQAGGSLVVLSPEGFANRWHPHAQQRGALRGRAYALPLPL